MEFHSLYETLGVEVDATDKEIKKAFRELSKKHHPDKGGDEELFKRISEAYSILSDPEKKKRYDSTGKIPKSEEMLHGEAMGVLRHLFGMSIDEMVTKRSMGGFGGYVQIQPDRILETMKGAIKDKVKAFKSTIEHNKKILTEFNKLKNAITYKKEEKDNLYIQTLNFKKTAVQRTIFDTENALEVAEIAKINLAGYVYNQTHEEEDDHQKKLNKSGTRLLDMFNKAKKKYPSPDHFDDIEETEVDDEGLF